MHDSKIIQFARLEEFVEEDLGAGPGLLSSKAMKRKAGSAALSTFSLGLTYTVRLWSQAFGGMTSTLLSFF